jgi:hypothetical protein
MVLRAAASEFAGRRVGGLGGSECGGEMIL